MFTLESHEDRGLHLTACTKLESYTSELCRRHEKNRKNFESTLKDATAAQKQAADGKQVYKETVEAMNSIAKSSKGVSTITRTIQDIAFQTNLLALNAGVEAARAGNAGSGFSVVASEVRSLAQKAAEAAKEISELIATSSQQVNLGVNLVECTGKKLDLLNETVNDLVRQVEGFRDRDSESASLANSIKEILSHEAIDESRENLLTSIPPSPVKTGASLRLTEAHKSREARGSQTALAYNSKSESLTSTSAFGRASHPDLAARSSSTLALPASWEHGSIVDDPVEDDWSQF